LDRRCSSNRARYVASICRSFIHTVSALFRTGAPKYSPR
jgi:hypothetical protein